MTPFEEGAGDGTHYELPWSAALLLVVPALTSLIVEILHGEFLQGWACFGLCIALSTLVGASIAAHYYPFYRARRDPMPVITTLGMCCLTAMASLLVSGIFIVGIEILFLGHPFHC
ncbi:MAG: hypothetical protein H6832_08100 [Planctomycetes bacterium]|nr:hypothetical protein [Planctomycetota bacterium]